VSGLALGIFWVAVAALMWVYLLYPMVARAYGALRPVRLTRGARPPALVTVGLAVHDGSAEIRERIANIVEQPVPFSLEVIVASDGSRDETPAIVREIGQADRRVGLLQLPRRGQSAAQSAIFEAARGDVVVLTDLQTRFADGCLAALVASLADRRVGCSTGVLRWRYDEVTQTARHEGLYWRYEQSVRAWESRAGWLSAGTGALLAARRSLYQPAPTHASLDQMLPLFCREAGALVVVAQDAIGTDRGTTSQSDQFASRVRIATQGIEANLRMSLRIRPWRQPGTTLAIWSHKLLRWATPLIGAAAVLSGIIVYASLGGLLYLLPVALGGLVALLANAGLVGRRIGRSIPLTGFPLTIAVVNLAFALAWLNVIRRRPIESWEPASDSG
jgi:cellulose synthase/poly-beta-1,6-N-acetylglucosamine synthase-like glycosyltransferase